MLQRIYGNLLPEEEESTRIWARIEEAKSATTAKLAAEPALTHLHGRGPAFLFFLPNGICSKTS